MKTILIKSFEQIDLDRVKNFADRWIGFNYYSLKELEIIRQQSCLAHTNASLLAFDGEQLIGVRLSLAPNSWFSSSLKVSPSRWQVAPESVGYFKSLFIHEDYRRMGLGNQMSRKSIEILVKMGAKAVVTHSWLESPNNSSQEYLLQNQFVEIARHANFWNHIDYLCTRCGPSRCVCSAVEMIKYILD